MTLTMGLPEAAEIARRHPDTLRQMRRTLRNESAFTWHTAAMHTNGWRLAGEVTVR